MILESPVRFFCKAKFVWWILLIVCLLYSGFALEMFVIELKRFSGGAELTESKTREAPIAFMLHALLGGIGLVAGVLQMNSQIRLNYPSVHLGFGRLYVLTICGASITGMWNAFYFKVPVAAQFIFFCVGAWWFLSTMLGYWYIRRRIVKLHRAWMLRSYAVSLFFLTFPIWVPTLQFVTVDAIAWPVGLLLAATLNMVIAEIYIGQDC
jgi:Predicted membrane protein (DUF2306)